MNEQLLDYMNRFIEERRYPKGKLRYDIICLENIEDIAKYSFVAHRSINYLDLSLKEFSSLREKAKVLVRLLFCSADPAYSKKFVCTAEGFRKTKRLGRRWLYTLHLDLPKNRECTLLSLADSFSDNGYHDQTFCFNQMFVPEGVYQKSFRRFIELALKQNGMEINFVRKQMALMKRTLNVGLFQVPSIEDSILNFLFSTCTDSDIVAEFLSIIDFNSWILINRDYKVLEYLVYHANRARYDLGLNDRQGSSMIECFFTLRFRFVDLLLKYQNAPFYYDYDSGVLNSAWMRDGVNGWYPEDLAIPFKKGMISKRRYAMWLQVFHAYVVRNQVRIFGSVGPTMRLIWRSLPDAYFTLDEMLRAYKDLPGSSDVIGQVYKYYVECVSPDWSADNTSMPRPLLHFCRIAIRKALCYNLQLPTGIEKLGVPPKLEAFIRLEK